MDNFIVSARKYRPETFQSVVGQASITGTLKSAIQKKQLGHAYLFCGPRGVGKTTCARILAKTINCLNPGSDAEPCNKCESCTSFNESRAFNIHELDAASNNSVDDIRNLNEQVRIPPQIGRYSVYIIDEVHMLSASAFNAFLKTLEEPPAHAIFILATTEKHKIIPTILSRCQIFDFQRIRVEDIISYLEFISREEGIEYEKDAFNLIALKADGAMRDALSIFDQMVSFSGKAITYRNVIGSLNILDYEYYFRMTDAALGGETGSVLTIFDEVLASGFDAQNLLTGLASHMRDLLVSRDEITLQLLEVGAGIRERYLEQSRALDQEWLYTALEILGAADLGYKSARNQRLHVELALVKLCRINRDPKKKAPVAESGSRGSSGKDAAAPEASQTGPEPGVPGESETVAGSGMAGNDDVPVEEDLREDTDTPGDAGVQVDEEAEGDEDTGGKRERKGDEGVPAGPEASGTSAPGKEGRPAGRPGRSIPGPGLSIKDALNGMGKQGGNDTGGKGPEKSRILSEPFTEEDLLHHWNAYADSILQERPRMANSLKHHLPSLGEALQIELVLSNSQQLEEFNRDIKPALVGYLEEALQNNRFKLIPVVSEDEQKGTRLYTSEEKFEHMKKKNPDLGKLKERFNLDFE